jgi:hypothetical protein
MTFALRTSLALALLLAGPLGAQPLFKNDGLLQVTITTNLRDLVRERDSTELAWFGGEFVYAKGDSSVTVPVELRARGHFRRQRSNCDFPPLFVRGDKDVIEGTELQGNPRVKLVTPCRPGIDEYRQYILMEYGMYQAYALLNEKFPRTRLAAVTYRDSADRAKPLTVPAFFLETDAEVAKQYDLTLRENMLGARFRDMDTTTLQRLALFEVMMGAGDWSLGGLHNIYLLQDSAGVFFPVAYDWDFSGLINARYATPAPVLPIKRVTERHYMGPCYTPEQWAPTIAHFQSKREALDALWSDIPGLEPKKQEQARKYLDSFWKILEDPKAFERLTKTCRKEGN